MPLIFTDKFVHSQLDGRVSVLIVSTIVVENSLTKFLTKQFPIVHHGLQATYQVPEDDRVLEDECRLSEALLPFVVDHILNLLPQDQGAEVGHVDGVGIHVLAGRGPEVLPGATHTGGLEAGAGVGVVQEEGGAGWVWIGLAAGQAVRRASSQATGEPTIVQIH